MRHMPWKELGWAFGFLALLLLIYIGTYAILVRPVQTPPPGALALPLHEFLLPDETGQSFQIDFDARILTGRIKPTYPFAEEFFTNLFTPIHELDTRLRQDVWQFRYNLPR